MLALALSACSSEKSGRAPAPEAVAPQKNLGQPITCADVGLSGTWTDANDHVFSISQDKCNVLLNDVRNNVLYTIPIDGSAGSAPYAFYAIQEKRRRYGLPEVQFTASANADKSVALKVAAIGIDPRSFSLHLDDSVTLDASFTVTAQLVKVPNVLKYSYYPQQPGQRCYNGYVTDTEYATRCDKYLVMNADNTAPKEIEMLKLSASNLSIESGKNSTGLTATVFAKLLSYSRALLGEGEIKTYLVKQN